MTDMKVNPSGLLDELLAIAPEKRQARLSAAGDPAPTLLAMIDDAARLMMVDAGRALEATAMTVALADALSLPAAQTRARRAHARALSYAGRYDEALRTCAEAADIATRTGQKDEAGRARLASMHALGETGRMREAIEAGEAARELFLSIPDYALAARADLNIGVTLQRQDDPNRALSFFNRARPFLIDDLSVFGPLESNRGEALLALNEFEGAEEAFQSAIEVFHASDSGLASSIVEGNLADLAVRQGRLAAALEHFERARQGFERSSSRGHLARLLAEQAEAKALLGLTEIAVREFDAALRELDRGNLPLEAARARAGLGLALFRLGRTSEAETALAAAAIAFKELGHATARARVDLMRAEIIASNGRPAEARAMVHKALAVLDSRPADAIVARHLLARLAIQMGEEDLAAGELSAALATARSLDLAPLLADILQTSARLNRQRGRIDAAVRDFFESVDQVERIRGSLHADRYRSAYLGSRSQLYEELVDATLEQPDADAVRRAFATAERCKGRTLLDQIATVLDAAPTPEPLPPPSNGAAQDDGMLARYAALRAELNALYSRLADEETTNRIAPDPRAWRQRLRDRERELESLEARLATSGRHHALYATPATVDETQARLDANERLIEYFATGDEWRIFVISRDEMTVHHGGSVSETTERLKRFRFQVERAMRPGALTGPRATRLIEDAESELRALHDLLIAPVAAAIDAAARVIIVPHGILHLLPFGALMDGTTPLLERVEITTAPSASVFGLLRERRRPSGEALRHALVTGFADDDAPWIADEARMVAGALADREVSTLLGGEATAERFAQAVSAAQVVHVACHGRFSSAHPLASGLRFADRWLTVREIVELELEPGLVTLSACETGVNLVSAGDELIGLMRGFLAAGAGALLVSLWPIHDKTTLELMQRFYDSWTSTSDHRRGFAGAIRTAQLETRREQPHPAFWAGFGLTSG